MGTRNTHRCHEGTGSLDELTRIDEGRAALAAGLVGLTEVMSGTFWSCDYGDVERDGTALIEQALVAVRRPAGRPTCEMSPRMAIVGPWRTMSSHGAWHI